MPASMSFEQHVSVIEAAGAQLAADALTAGLAALVPTCPTWTVAHLVAHQAMVHRWAASHARGTPEDARSQTEIREQEPDLHGYYETGLAELTGALRAAPPDLATMTFLADVASPREFWARRQAHETTVHAVDARAARLGRMPLAAETPVTTEVAVDGIDEILRGFYTRGRSKLYDGEELSFVVAPSDSDRRWHVTVAERMTVSDDGPADSTLTGTAAQLYLGLWNRGDEIEGDHVLLSRWRKTHRIRWS